MEEVLGHLLIGKIGKVRPLCCMNLQLYQYASLDQSLGTLLFVSRNMEQAMDMGQRGLSRVDQLVFYSPPRVSMESLWSPHNFLKVLIESSQSPRGVLMESSQSPHRVLMESMDFGWTMISFGKIYPCRSVIVSTLILAHFFTASTLQVDAIITSNKYILQSHILTSSYPHSCRVT